MKQAAWLVVAALVSGAPAQAQEGASIRAPDLSLDLARQPAQPEEPAKEIPAKPPPPPAFGAASSKWWTVGGGVASNFADATDVDLRFAYSHFLVKDVEFGAEMNLWYFHQDGPDAAGFNPAMVFRWHFYDDGKWTLFGDVGIGLLLASDDVPVGGTAFDFTPRVGVGFTRELDPETRTRLQVGLRWHHISNARLSGAADNPSRDGVMLYAALQFPF
jgi:hypothetical protein